MAEEKYGYSESADHANVRAIFKQWDSTGRGTLQKEELRSILSEIGITDQELAVLETTDACRDQSSHYSDFLRWVFAPASSPESGDQAGVSRQRTESAFVPDGAIGCEGELEANEAENDNGDDIFEDIFEAAEAGNVEAVRRFLRVDPESLEKVDESGAGPLTLAASRGHLELVEVLLAAGACVEVQDRFGDGPLHLAAKEGYLEVVQVLLAAGASVEARDFEGLTPLHWAAVGGATPLCGGKGHAAIVERLLAAGAAVDAAANDGWTPLHYAVNFGHIAALERLLAAGAAMEAAVDSWTPLHRAAMQGQAAAVEKLIAAGAAVDAVEREGWTPLHLAAGMDEAAVVERLIASGAAVDAVDGAGLTPYDTAQQRGQRNVMGVLDPVYVALISGRSCKCNSFHETVEDLKKEAERKLGIAIQHLIGPDMQPLNGAMSLEEANILPGNTLTAVIDLPSQPAEESAVAPAVQDAQEDPLVVKDVGHGIFMKTKQSIFDTHKLKIDILDNWTDLKDPSSLEKVLPSEHVALSQLVRLSPEDVSFPATVEVEMPTCVAAESVWRSSATGWEALGAKFSDGRVVVALSHFCDLVVTGPCGLKAVGFIDPHGANAKVALLHVACESCQNSLEQLCSDVDMLRSFKRCGPSVPLGTYRHDEDLQLRQGEEAVNMRVRFHRMPQLSRKLVASASHFNVEIEGDDHHFEELGSEAASDLHAAPPTSQAMLAGAAPVGLEALTAQEWPEKGHLLLSGRFNNETTITYMKAVQRRLGERRVPVYMVQAQVGQSFAELTRIGLGRAKGMVAFCTSEYGAYTGAGYETFHELEYAHDNN